MNIPAVPPGRTECFLARDEYGRQVITALVKRTFDITPAGLRTTEEQPDFVGDDESQAKETEPGSFPVAEVELLPYKLGTDIVVTGNVIAPGERPVRQMYVAVQIGQWGKVIAVFGDRLIEMTAGGVLQFSDPEPFVTLPLTYARAYGGVDPSVPRNENPQNAAEWFEYITLECHPGVYPRNPVGQAYVVNPHRWLLNGRPLPNFEDPNDLLTPARIVVGQPEKWWLQPMPAGLGWYGKSWYPRAVYGGILPRFLPDERNVREVQLGFVSQDQITIASNRPLEDRVQPSFFNGASPGLVFPRIQGNERVRVAGMDPAGDITFDLPGAHPRFRIMFAGEILPMAVHIHTVWIQKDKNQVSMIWSANAYPPRMLPITLPSRDEPMVDELEGVTVFVDEQEVSHEPMNLGKVPF